MSKKDSYFVLAKIWATLSGMFIVGAGIFANVMTSSFIAIQNNVKIIHSVNSTDVKDYLIIANNLLGSYTKLAYNIFIALLVLGLLSVVLTLYYWRKGHKLTNK